jgi:hypothetical protein
MVFMHLWNSSTDAKCIVFLVLHMIPREKMPWVHMDRQTDEQTDTLIQVGLGNLIRFLQGKYFTYSAGFVRLSFYCSFG